MHVIRAIHPIFDRYQLRCLFPVRGSKTLDTAPPVPERHKQQARITSKLGSIDALAAGNHSDFLAILDIPEHSASALGHGPIDRLGVPVQASLGDRLFHVDPEWFVRVVIVVGQHRGDPIRRGPIFGICSERPGQVRQSVGLIT